ITPTSIQAPPRSPICAAATWLVCIYEPPLSVVFSVIFSAISHHCHHLFPLIATSQHKILIKGVVSAILIR
ncbi:hypothetical protein RI534_20230, partial [Aeromonas allosaccharophila]|uniref:hypothetical protein n=1 Tax=Aeromonas allosaccharophila TaxID=656 RepID=UPI003441B4DE